MVLVLVNDEPMAFVASDIKCNATKVPFFFFFFNMSMTDLWQRGIISQHRLTFQSVPHTKYQKTRVAFCHIDYCYDTIKYCYYEAFLKLAVKITTILYGKAQFVQLFVFHWRKKHEWGWINELQLSCSINSEQQWRSRCNKVSFLWCWMKVPQAAFCWGASLIADIADQ